MNIASKPSFPAISISDDAALVLVTNEDGFKKVSTRALIDVTFLQDTIFFDSQGQRWNLKLRASTLKSNRLTWILANTFYNPLHHADLEWSWIARYGICELKEKIKTCIQKDDDILTQFVDGEVIQSAIGDAVNFEEIFSVLNKFIFGVDEQKNA